VSHSLTAIAHRCPPSAQRCAELVSLGATVFEIDVQSAGGELVSSHFLPLVRALPRLRHDGLQLTWRARDRRERLLREAVAVVPPPARILLDLKTDSGPAAHALSAAVVGADLEPERFIVCTKGWDTLPVVRAHGLPTWRTVGDAAALRAVLAGGPLPDEAVTVWHQLLNPAVVEELHGRGTRVMTWTVNDLTRARRLIEFGVDGITSDNPTVLREVAATRR
jgi:glycerophosphoryl diester phosphodiesterase